MAVAEIITVQKYCVAYFYFLVMKNLIFFMELCNGTGSWYATIPKVDYLSTSLSLSDINNVVVDISTPKKQKVVNIY